MNLLWWLIIGGLAGWVAGLIMKGRGFGVVGDIIVGIIGAIVGGLVFQALGITTSVFFTALIGAIILLFIAGLVRQAEV